MAMTAALSSTAGLGLSGLSSGLDTSGIITKLMWSSPRRRPR